MSNIKIFNMVVVSPKEQAAQRAVCKKVVVRVNQTLDGMNKGYRLKAIDQKDVKPEAGKAQDVASKNLQIENCHILIGIFGREFGSEPNTKRERDGHIYQSGTEQEIDEAFEARKQNHDLRPSIMLYRQEDVSTADMSENDVLQYAKVINYFNECKPTGNHPAFVYLYKTNPPDHELGFEDSLEEHLIKTCQENEEAWLNEASEPPRSKRLSQAEEWIKSVGLKGNPFAINLPEKVFQEEFTVNFPELSNQQKFHLLYEAHDPIYIFGAAGCGKTTLLENILAEGQAYMNANTRVKLCFARLGAPHFDIELERIDDWQSDFKPSHMARLICRGVEANLKKGLSRTLPELGITDYSQPVDALNKLMEWLKKADGYTDLVCLVDELDDVNKIRSEHPRHKAILALLRTMLLLPKMEGIKMRYFLPAVLEESMQAGDKELFRTDKFTRIHLVWDEARMKEMISQRMIATSIPTGFYYALDSLCERRNGDQETIDSQIARLSFNNPRALIWLANRLFEKHLEQRPIPAKIQPAAWQIVKLEWEREKYNYNQIPGETAEFEVKNGSPYFSDKKITLSKIPERLLNCLIEAAGETCSREKLIQAGWPEVKEKDRSGVSDKTYYANISFIKTALDKIAPAWLINDRGKGYSLRQPNQKDGENAGGNHEH